MERSVTIRGSAPVSAHAAAANTADLGGADGDERPRRTVRGLNVGTAGALGAAAPARPHQGATTTRAKFALALEPAQQLGARTVCSACLRTAAKFLATCHSRHWRDAKRVVVRLCNPLPARVPDLPQDTVADPCSARVRDRHHEQLGYGGIPAVVLCLPALDSSHATVPRRPAAEAGVERPGWLISLFVAAGGRHDIRQRRELRGCTDGQPWSAEVVPREPV